MTVEARTQGLALQHLSPFGMMSALPQSAHLGCGSICPWGKTALSGITCNRPGGSLYIFHLFGSEKYRLGWPGDGWMETVGWGGTVQGGSGWRLWAGVAQFRGAVDGDHGLGWHNAGGQWMETTVWGGTVQGGSGWRLRARVAQCRGWWMETAGWVARKPAHWRGTAWQRPAQAQPEVPKYLGASGPSLERSLQGDQGDGPGGGHWVVGTTQRWHLQKGHRDLQPMHWFSALSSCTGSLLCGGLGWLSAAWLPQPALCTCCPSYRDSHTPPHTPPHTFSPPPPHTPPQAFAQVTPVPP